MKLDILNVDRFVQVNRLERVTDTIFFEKDGTPTERGLFSYRIFGRPGSEQRREKFAYIDLGAKLMHPAIYKACTQLDRKFEAIVAGTRFVRVGAGGKLEDDEVGGWTGIDAIHDHWDEIKWGAEGKGQRKERIRLLRGVTQSEAFVTKWPVIPALYRDVDTRDKGRPEISPENSLYVQLLAADAGAVTGFSILDGSRRRRAQEALLELHQALLDKTAKKRGLIQYGLISKFIDYSVRGVLSGPKIMAANRAEEMEVQFGSLGIPLHLCLNLFLPFVIKDLDERLARLRGDQESVVVSQPDGTAKRLEIPPAVRAEIGSDLYKRWISHFMRSQESRTDPLSVRTQRGDEFILPLYDGVLGRPTTLADLLFISVSTVTADKHVLFTRYPVEDFRAPHFGRVTILTTERTAPKNVGGSEYPRYPVLDGKEVWLDAFRLHNSYAAAMGADYDGDTIRAIGLFSQEANAEAARMISSPAYIVDGQGRFSRKTANEATLTLYSLTK